MTDRGTRRHAAEMAKARARRQIRSWAGDRADELADDPRFVGRRAATPNPCSRECCGNQRRYHGPTRQERLATRSPADRLQ